jgi:hypothetical protein
MQDLMDFYINMQPAAADDQPHPVLCVSDSAVSEVHPLGERAASPRSEGWT